MQYINQNFGVEGRGGGGKGGGGGSQRVAREAPNSLQTKNVARIIDLIGEGMNGGLVDGLKSVYLDETPVLEENGNENFTGISIQERLGAPDQDPLEGFSEIEEEKIVGVVVEKAFPVTRAVTDPDVDSVRIKVQFPALLKQDKTNGDISPTTVRFRILRRPSDGSFETVQTVTIREKTNSLQELGYRVRKPSGVTGEWEWRVERLTEDSESSALQNRIQVGSVTWITESRLYYPYSHVIGVEADAEQFGDRIPNRSYHIRGLSDLLIPSNYDPETRTYDGLWDGAFKTGWTNNPAWIVYNILSRKLWGLGRFISPEHLAQIKWDCYEAGQYTDELVPDGFGGMEPRFTCNGVIARQEDALTVLGSIASTLRGMIYWSAGGLMLTTDRPKSSCRLVNQANVVGGRFERPGIRHRDLVTSVKVAWNDPRERFRRAVEVVEDNAAIRRFGVRSAQLVAFLCTSRGQARRVGRWVLASQQLQPVVFQGGSDLSDLRPGDVVRILDPEEVGVRLGGRLVSGTTSQVEIDAPVNLQEGRIYTLSVRLPDGTCEDRMVVNGSGEATILDLATPLSSIPVDGAIWLLYHDLVEPELARVVTVTEPEEGVFQFECLGYNPSLFEKVDLTGTFEEPRTSLIPEGPLPIPSELKLTEYLYSAGPSVAGGASIEWRQPADVRVRNTEIQLARPGDSFKPYALATAPPVEVRDVGRGLYSVRVRFVDGVGRRGPWTMLTKELFGLTADPAPLANLRIAKVGGLAVLTWDPAADLDVRVGGSIHIRHSVTGNGLGSSVRVLDPLPGASVQATVPLMPGTYYVFAKDSGNRPGPVTELATDGATVLPYSSVGVIQADPNWVGTKENVFDLNGALKLSSSGSFQDIPVFETVNSMSNFGGLYMSGTYTMAAGLDLGSVRPVRLMAHVAMRSLNLIDSFANRSGSFNTWPSFIGEPLGETDATVEVRTTSDDPNVAPVWSEFEELTVGEYMTRAVEARLRLTTDDPDQSIIVDTFKIEASEAA